MINEPLGLPKGSVRGLLALMMGATFCFTIGLLAWHGKIVVTGKDLVYIIIIVYQTYFITKKQKGDTDEKK